MRARHRPNAILRSSGVLQDGGEVETALRDMDEW
jgi:hypothetical protein